MQSDVEHVKLAQASDGSIWFCTETAQGWQPKTRVTYIIEGEVIEEKKSVIVS